MKLNLCIGQFSLLVIVFLFCQGCGTLDYFKNDTAQSKPVPEKPAQDPERIKALETELSDVKARQTELQGQIQQKEKKIKTLEKTIAGLKEKITRLKTQKRLQSNVSRSKTPSTPAELYKRARNLLLEDDYDQAAALFNDFIQQHPNNSLADNAMYWLAECHYSAGEYKKAVAVFRQLEVRYPKSEKVPDAILKTGYSFLALEDANRAHHYLKKVLKKYPFSPAAEKAQEKLSSFQ